MSHKQQEKKAQQKKFEPHRKELDQRDKKIKEDKLRQQLRDQKKAQQIFERERKELKKQKRKSISTQSASIHSLAANQANQLKRHLNKAQNDLRKTKQLLVNTKSTLNRKNQDMRDLKQDNAAKVEQIKFLTRRTKNMTKTKKDIDVHSDQQSTFKHLKAQIANLKNKLKISEQIKHPSANKDNDEAVKDTQEFETKYNDLQHEVEALQLQLKDYINLDPPPRGKEMRKIIEKKLQNERDAINNEIQNNNKLKQKPLHRFSYN
eukprot:143446_1